MTPKEKKLTELLLIEKIESATGKKVFLEDRKPVSKVRVTISESRIKALKEAKKSIEEAIAMAESGTPMEEGIGDMLKSGAKKVLNTVAGEQTKVQWVNTMVPYFKQHGLSTQSPEWAAITKTAAADGWDGKVTWNGNIPSYVPGN